MVKAKTKAAGTNLPVPQSDAEAEQLIARLGALQRDHATSKAAHDAQVAVLEEKFGTAKKVFEEVQGVLTDALSLWASANRERLTQGGKTKTVQLPTGSLSWREGRFSVKQGRMKNDDVVAAIGNRIATLEDEATVARRERRRNDAAAICAKIKILEGFLRTKVEPNKEAMLSAREVAELIPGVTVPRGDEEFIVEPLASQISEVA